MKKNQIETEKITLDWGKGQLVLIFNPERVVSHDEMLKLSTVLNTKPTYLMVKKGLIKQIKYIPYPSKDVISLPELKQLLDRLSSQIEDESLRRLLAEEFLKTMRHIPEQETNKS